MSLQDQTSIGPNLLEQLGQYCKQSWAKVQVPSPDLVKRYNQGMGGVDHMYGSAVTYRVN